jgi:BlaI family penicillinase repressor
MEKLTDKEEEVMQILWDLERAVVNDIIQKLPDPKPPYTTISSIVRILEKKGFAGHKPYGKTHEYFPLISKPDYRKRHFRKLLQNYFDNSLESIVSFIGKEEKLTEEEIMEIKRIINRSSDKKKKGK